MKRDRQCSYVGTEVAGKQINGQYDLGQKYRWTFNHIQRQHTLGGQEQSHIPSQRSTISENTSFGNTIRRPITGRIGVQKDEELLLWTKGTKLKDGQRGFGDGSSKINGRSESLSKMLTKSGPRSSKSRCSCGFLYGCGSRSDGCPRSFQHLGSRPTHMSQRKGCQSGYRHNSPTSLTVLVLVRKSKSFLTKKKKQLTLSLCCGRGVGPTLGGIRHSDTLDPQFVFSVFLPELGSGCSSSPYLP